MKKILSLVLLVLSFPSFADWKIQEASFLAESLTKIGTGRKDVVSPDHHFFSTAYMDSYAFKNRIEIKGSIYIREYNEETLSKRETIMSNVFLVMKTYGLLLRAGVVKDAYFPLKGLKGKPIASIFDSTFHGGKIGAGAGLIVGAYPNYSFLMNDQGIRIHNIERMLRFDLNIGVEAGYVSMDFNTNSLGKNGRNTVTITSGDVGSGEKKTQKLNLDQVMDTVVGE